MSGNIRANVLQCRGLFKAARLPFTFHDDDGYDVGTAAEFANVTYVEEWRTLLHGQRYDFRFDDLSLLQFRATGEGPEVELRYAFYEAPVRVVGYRSFLQDFLATTFNEAGYGAWSEYEEYVFTAPARPATPIRYDYSARMYTEGVHPASHVHVGYRNQVRLGTAKCWRPMTFALFVLRQAYPDVWKEFLGHSQAATMARFIRASLVDVPGDYVRARDDWQAMLR